MLLLIDAGNTRIKWAVCETGSASQAGNWLAQGVIEHAQLAEYRFNLVAHPVRYAIISNVAGDAAYDALLKILGYAGIAAQRFVSEPAKAGVTNQYANPAQLGSDRFASAIGAHHLFPERDVVVATCGTATTVDWVTSLGAFEGGMIVPGLRLMAESLALNTAQLPQLEQVVESVPGMARDTKSAIWNGCLAAQIGAIEYAIRYCTEQRRSDSSASAKIEPPLCVLSGGGAKYIAPNLKAEHKMIENLVLIGLQVSA